MKKRKHIYLTGIMGSGKSTVGKLLARNLSYPFIDTDHEIVKREKRSINKIFETDGEDYFRNLETQVLKDLDPSSKMIVATGGGIVLRSENREIMSNKGIVFFLDTPVEQIAKRLEGDTERPLLKNSPLEERLNTLLDQRYEFYKDKSIRLDADMLTPFQAVNVIKKILKS